MICGKQVFISMKDAVAAINGSHKDKRKSKSNKRPSKTYFCEICNGWHLTSQEQRRSKMHLPKEQTHNTNTGQQLARCGFVNKNLTIHTRLNFKVK